MAKKTGDDLDAKADTDLGPMGLGHLPHLIGYQLRRAQTHMRRDYIQTIGDLGFRPGQVSVLVLIVENPGATQVEISRELEVDKATIVSLIDRLEKAGQVTRQRSSKDRRKQALFATRDGIEMAKRLILKTEEHEERYRKQFSDDELKLLLGFLKRIYRPERS